MKNKFLKKIKIITVAVVVFVSAPLAGRAFSGWMLVVKEYGLDPALRVITKEIFDSLNIDILKTINEAGRGAKEPAYIQNWREFLVSSQRTGEAVALSMIEHAIEQGTVCLDQDNIDKLKAAFNLDNLRNGGLPGLDSQTAKILILNASDSSSTQLGSLTSFFNKISCTAEGNNSVLTGQNGQPFTRQDFYNDFTNGGWDALIELAKPQNNLDGIVDLIFSEISKQREFQQKLNENETISGGGFLSLLGGQSCGTDNHLLCDVIGQISTPGSLFKGSVDSVINQNLDWFVSSDELLEIVSALLGNITGVLQNLSNPSSPNTNGRNFTTAYDPQTDVNNSNDPKYTDANIAANNARNQIQGNITACILQKCGDYRLPAGPDNICGQAKKEEETLRLLGYQGPWLGIPIAPGLLPVPPAPLIPGIPVIPGFTGLDIRSINTNPLGDPSLFEFQENAAACGACVAQCL